MRGLIVALIVALPFGSQAAPAADITGAWESNQGPITIVKNPDDTYSVTFQMIKGRTTGTLDGDVFKGSWVRDKEELAERCKTDKDGRPFWGGFKITFYEGIGFQGAWHFCGDGVHIMNWTGARPKQ